MKMQPLSSLLAGAMILLGGVPNLTIAQPAQPVITSIHSQGTNLVVTVDVPQGIQRVTLESRARFGAGAWEPAAVAQVAGRGGSLTFLVPCARQSEMLRVRADPQQALPATFYGGTNAFGGAPTNASLVPGNNLPSGVIATDGPMNSPGTDRAVVESDIWQINGDRLYFFNQYRGLQVIDISHPDAAAVQGTLSLPAAGEQMYLADSNHVVLLARNGCGYEVDGSQVLVVAVSNSLPQVTAKLSLQGYIQESRMVGTALYVASQTYRQVPDPTQSIWEWGTLVSSFDFADPDAPVVRDTLWYPGYGNVVAATDTCLFVVTQDPTNWWQSVVHIADIAAPDGSLAKYASLRLSGRVADKFKLNYADGVLTTISEDWHWNNGTTLVTRLETFTLPDPRSAGPLGVVQLGELELGNGERLHATRFDGNLAYVVTFYQIDPLWVVDLSEPAKPHVAGALEVPGWSTYIQPLGSRLVAVGVESNRVAVSLFDVHDPARPGLLSRVLLGQSYSWSEANNDEKAFTVVTENGLILVPYSGDTTNGWSSQVQLIDLTETNLLARGIIQHQCQPRRAAYAHERILSLSGWELLSVDATDRDHPEVRGDLELAWSVDQLFVQGDFLLELESSAGWWWGPQSTPTLRVTTVDRPDGVLAELQLTNWPVVGAALKGERLYLAQNCSYSYPPDTNGPNFLLTVVEAGELPKLSILGQTWAKLDLPGWTGNLQAVWPQPDLLVWAGGGWRNWWYMTPLNGPSGVLGGGVAMPWPIWRGGGGQLFAFDVSTPVEPKLLSEINFSTNGWSSFSRSFCSGTLVYLSHCAAEVLPDPKNPAGTWVQRSYLDVIDYADPASPTVRQPVNLPGTLQGLSAGGELLYTTGYHWVDQNTDWKEWLDSSAYDGVTAHLVASMPLPNVWPHPVLVVDTNIFLGRPGYNYTDTNVVAHQLETWTLAERGQFTRLANTALDQPATALVARGSLLATQETDNSVVLFLPSASGSLEPAAHAISPGCLGFDLNEADGSAGEGLWLPLSAYGVRQIGLTP